MPAEIRRKVEGARAAGGAARRAGRPFGANPYRGSSSLVVLCHDAWRMGWDAEDASQESGAMRISFSVLGIPGPQGSKKFVGLRKNGARKGTAILVESSKKVKPWRELVESLCAAISDRSACPTSENAGIGYPFPLDGPLVLRLVFTMPKPASAPKRAQILADEDARRLEAATLHRGRAHPGRPVDR